MGRTTKQERARRDKLAEQGIKVCSTCEKEKAFSEFGKSNNAVYGLYNACKACRKQHYQEKKERISEYYKENREYILAHKQKPEVKARISQRAKERRQSEPVFRMSAAFRTLLWHGFKQKGWKKDSSTQSILGCSWEQVVLWLGGEPNKNMHVDHVVPQSLARTPEELKLLNHYTNLQLLTAEQNVVKGNRYVRGENLNRVLAYHPQPSKLKEIVQCSNIEIK